MAKAVQLEAMCTDPAGSASVVLASIKKESMPPKRAGPSREKDFIPLTKAKRREKAKFFVAARESLICPPGSKPETVAASAAAAKSPTR